MTQQTGPCSCLKYQDKIRCGRLVILEMDAIGGKGRRFSDANLIDVSYMPFSSGSGAVPVVFLHNASRPLSHVSSQSKDEDGTDYEANIKLAHNNSAGVEAIVTSNVKGGNEIGASSRSVSMQT